MSSIGKRLLASTADLAAVVAAKSATGAAEPSRPNVPRTAPGQMLAARTEMLSMQGELAELRERLKQFDGSLPTLRIRPEAIRATSLANRHESSFATASFARLKASIESAGGNTQPILVRKSEEADAYEIVFGHRRHRACLELGVPVLAVVWNGPMADVDLFVSMDRENREREDPSTYEQGATYLAALEAGLFPSQRRLAEAIGVSHTWVRKATMVAQLPPALLEAFGSPIEIQARHAEQLLAALDLDKKAVLRRAESLRQLPKRPGASQVVAQLVGRSGQRTSSLRLKVGKRMVGTWRRDGKGRAVITLDASYADDTTMHKLSVAIAQVLASEVET